MTGNSTRRGRSDLWVVLRWKLISLGKVVFRHVSAAGGQSSEAIARHKFLPELLSSR